MKSNKIERYFTRFKYFCSALSIVLMIWLFCHLFIRSCGGPFPYRVRGPFANQEYYKLGDLPEWENFLSQPDTDRTLSEMLIEGEDIPELNFSKRDRVPEKPLEYGTMNKQLTVPTLIITPSMTPTIKPTEQPEEDLLIVNTPKPESSDS